ncbi:hypothetical protein HHS34_002215 [Acidithiobacillus montserratensis]|uniref:Uncharacterized protein n=1 Tax=Acidithiobacillus montserratensis TaxID=2729135 RepID=A0ACD5HJA4_9PROT|nr:hypothetical protein [Acidithiobacillus montserratensis]MBU2747230.1 hypothetical protein [Acidithiobacillus montserratensis]
MGSLSGLLSGLLSALGLGDNGTSTPSLQSVSTVGAEMNQAVSQSVTDAATLTSEGIGYASGELTSTLTKTNSLLTSGILGAENAFPGLLEGGGGSTSISKLENSLISDGNQAGMALSNFASTMPTNVATGIADNVKSLASSPLVTDIGGYLFY